MTSRRTFLKILGYGVVAAAVPSAALASKPKRGFPGSVYAPPGVTSTTSFEDAVGRVCSPPERFTIGYESVENLFVALTALRDKHGHTTERWDDPNSRRLGFVDVTTGITHMVTMVVAMTTTKDVDAGRLGWSKDRVALSQKLLQTPLGRVKLFGKADLLRSVEVLRVLDHRHESSEYLREHMRLTLSYGREAQEVGGPIVAGTPVSDECWVPTQWCNLQNDDVVRVRESDGSLETGDWAVCRVVGTASVHPSALSWSIQVDPVKEVVYQRRSASGYTLQSLFVGNPA